MEYEVDCRHWFCDGRSIIGTLETRKLYDHFVEYDALGGGGLKMDGSIWWKFLVGTQSARSRGRVGSLETVLRHLGAKMASKSAKMSKHKRSRLLRATQLGAMAVAKGVSG